MTDLHIKLCHKDTEIHNLRIIRARTASSEGPIVFASIVIILPHFLVLSRAQKLTHFVRRVRPGGLYVLVELLQYDSVAPATHLINTCAIGVSFV